MNRLMKLGNLEKQILEVLSSTELIRYPQISNQTGETPISLSVSQIANRIWEDNGSLNKQIIFLYLKRLWYKGLLIRVAVKPLSISFLWQISTHGRLLIKRIEAHPNL